MRLPLPHTIEPLRPEWMMLMFIFWGVMAPERVTVIVSFCVGLFLDVLTGAPLGQYALTMTLLVYFVQFFKNRYRLFTTLQQGFLILFLVGTGKITLLMIHWLLGHPPISLWYFASVLTSILFWPFLYRILRYYA